MSKSADGPVLPKELLRVYVQDWMFLGGFAGVSLMQQNVNEKVSKCSLEVVLCLSWCLTRRTTEKNPGKP